MREVKASALGLGQTGIVIKITGKKLIQKFSGENAILGRTIQKLQIVKKKDKLRIEIKVVGTGHVILLSMREASRILVEVAEKRKTPQPRFLKKGGGKL